jgi:hypothetical protein
MPATTRLLRTALISLAVASPGGASPAPSGPVVPPDLSGRWSYSAQLSDDARQKLREGMARESPHGLGPLGGVPVGPGSSTLLQQVFEPAEELTITQAAGEVVIDEEYGRRRALHPDGRKRKSENGSAETKVEWREGRLVVDTRDREGLKLVEAWELSASRERLIVEVKVERRVGPKLLLRRVYERALPR